MNNIIISGRLTNNPKMRETKIGTVVNFTLAVDRGGKDKGADFINCVAFKKTAEFIEQYSAKGKRAIVSGRLSISSYETENGEKKKKTEILVNNFDIIDWKDKDEKKPVENGTKGSETDSEEIPF